VGTGEFIMDRSNQIFSQGITFELLAKYFTEGLSGIKRRNEVGDGVIISKPFSSNFHPIEKKTSSGKFRQRLELGDVASQWYSRITDLSLFNGSQGNFLAYVGKTLPDEGSRYQVVISGDVCEIGLDEKLINPTMYSPELERKSSLTNGIHKDPIQRTENGYFFFKMSQDMQQVNLVTYEFEDRTFTETPMELSGLKFTAEVGNLKYSIVNPQNLAAYKNSKENTVFVKLAS
jgi:hypothetical protein